MREFSLPNIWVVLKKVLILHSEINKKERRNKMETKKFPMMIVFGFKDAIEFTNNEKVAIVNNFSGIMLAEDEEERERLTERLSGMQDICWAEDRLDRVWLFPFYYVKCKFFVATNNGLRYGEMKEVLSLSQKEKEFYDY